MSLAAMLWALNEAPVDDPTAVLVLIALADHADEAGRGTYPSVARVAVRARCSERTAQRHLRALEADGVIERDDDRLARHIRPDRRPVVWRLRLDLRRGDNLTPRRPSRGDTGGTHGVTPVSPEPSLNRSTPQPPQVGELDECDEHGRGCRRRACGRDSRSAARRARLARPEWCGECDPETRQVGRMTDTPSRCPVCHPLSPLSTRSARKSVDSG